jgi:peptidoglycan/xylan/chitin deacetylase (PgdA/CDA1 family)
VWPRVTRNGALVLVDHDLSLPDGMPDRMPAVLMYHSVAPGHHDQYTIHPDQFEQQMRWLHRRGRKGTSVRECLEAWSHGDGHEAVGLSFDDGYADFAEYVLPVLDRYGFSATVFVVAGRLGGDSSWDPEFPPKPLLTAEQVRQLAEAGIEIGSHSLHHVPLPSTTETELTKEVQRSRRILRDVTKQDIAGFAYPYGQLDDRSLNAVRAGGYDYSCAVWRTVFAGRYALPRINMQQTDSPSRLWAKGVRHWLRWEYRGPGSHGLVAAAKLRRRITV